MENKIAPVSDETLLELKKKITQSEDVSTDNAKKILIWFIEQSNNASESIALYIIDRDLATEVQSSVHGMCSSQGTTHLDGFMKGNGFSLLFSHCCGTFNDRGIFDPKLHGVTIWLSAVMYDKKAKKINYDLEEALKIDLEQYQ